MNNINLIRCNHGHKINKDNIFRIIKHYEILTKNKLSLSEKDYISDRSDGNHGFRRHAGDSALS